MNISKEINSSVATLKEKFARAGRGKKTPPSQLAKKHVIDEPSEQKYVER